MSILTHIWALADNILPSFCFDLVVSFTSLEFFDRPLVRRECRCFLVRLWT